MGENFWNELGGLIYWVSQGVCVCGGLDWLVCVLLFILLYFSFLYLCIMYCSSCCLKSQYGEDNIGIPEFICLAHIRYTLSGTLRE